MQSPRSGHITSNLVTLHLVNLVTTHLNLVTLRVFNLVPYFIGKVACVSVASLSTSPWPSARNSCLLALVAKAEHRICEEQTERHEGTKFGRVLH